MIIAFRLRTRLVCTARLAKCSVPLALRNVWVCHACHGIRTTVPCCLRQSMVIVTLQRVEFTMEEFPAPPRCSFTNQKMTRQSREVVICVVPQFIDLPRFIGLYRDLLRSHVTNLREWWQNKESFRVKITEFPASRSEASCQERAGSFIDEQTSFLLFGTMYCRETARRPMRAISFGCSAGSRAERRA